MEWVWGGAICLGDQWKCSGENYQYFCFAVKKIRHFSLNIGTFEKCFCTSCSVKVSQRSLLTPTDSSLAFSPQYLLRTHAHTLLHPSLSGHNIYPSLSFLPSFLLLLISFSHTSPYIPLFVFLSLCLLELWVVLKCLCCVFFFLMFNVSLTDSPLSFKTVDKIYFQSIVKYQKWYSIIVLLQLSHFLQK